jgi:DNA-binding beta-propeller fold protein YncE
MKRTLPALLALLLLACTAMAAIDDDGDRPAAKKDQNISTGMRLITPAPGAPRSTNSLPMTMALSPDKHWLAILNAGYGTKESGYKQSIAILNTDTDSLHDFPDDRLGNKAKQSYFVGLAWSNDGHHLYASIASLTDPEAKQKNSTGNGIAVYAFANGTLTPDRFIRIPLQPAPAGKRITKVDKSWPDAKSACYPAGLAVPSAQTVDLPSRSKTDSSTQSTNQDRLVVACNLSDSVLLLNASTGAIEHTFDVSQSDIIPSAYPYSIVTSPDGRQAWVSLWNSSRIVELHLGSATTPAPAPNDSLQTANNTSANSAPATAPTPADNNTTPPHIVRTIDIHRPKDPLRAGSHPSALALSGSWLYVTLSSRDEVAAIDAASGKVKKFISVRMEGQHDHGSYPSALAVLPWPNPRIYVANSASNSVADLSITGTDAPLSCPDTCTHPRDRAPKPRLMSTHTEGFIPTEWYPTALAIQGDYLYIATAKGRGQGPNSAKATTTSTASKRHGHPYIASLMHGSLAKVKITDAERDLHALTEDVLHANRMDEHRERFTFATGRNPIRHVIYIIKENRTYDQLFGDIASANGDDALTLFGERITPNQHALARQFGVLDNFYDSGEVSGSGHVWSTAAITSDYTEHTWQIAYRGHERTYDYEGNVGNATPLAQNIPDVNEPGTGYLWTNAARHHLTYRHYGEYVTSRWCLPDDWDSPTEGSPSLAPTPGCPKSAILHGEPLPSLISGVNNAAPSPYPWPIPILKSNNATKPELRDHFDPHFADFRIDYPDQLRADEFLREFHTHVTDLAAGRDTLPQLTVMRLPNDHTAAEKANKPTPEAAVADNDLALGRVVEAISHSPYWDNTAIFVLEDDAQDGADHVDAHRSISLVISRYSPRGRCAPDSPATRTCPFVDSRFYTTVSTIATIEALLGLPPMNNNDAHSSLMTPLFTGPGDQPPFTADFRNRDNGLLYHMNKKDAAGAKASAALDLSHADAADPAILNSIVWHSIKGDAPVPEPVHNIFGP